MTIKRTVKIGKKERMAQIINVALIHAEKIGYQSLSRKIVADLAGVTPSLIHYHFKSMGKFKKLLMKGAVTREILPIIAQGLSARDPIALKAPDELKKRVMLYLMQ
jgi:AcrR family transcriptional regulator